MSGTNHPRRTDAGSRLVWIPSPPEIERDIYDLIHPADKIEALETYMSAIFTNLRFVESGVDHQIDPKLIERWESMLPVLVDQLIYWRGMMRFAPDEWMRGKRKSNNYLVLTGENHVLDRIGTRRWKWKRA